MTSMAPAVVTAKFYSDTNLSLFAESLDYLVATNLWEIDRATRTIKFFEPIEDTVKNRITSFGGLVTLF